MKDRLRIGTVGAGLSRTSGVFLSLDELLRTRMLLQANSGGGKSYMARKVCEEAAGCVPVLVLDPEGEFGTLRECHDMVLVGNSRDADLPADVKNAQALARRLSELNVSAVVDLYELRLGDRRKFVRLFLDALMNLPKRHQHPALVVLDEAQVFCPERSSGQSEAMDSVIALMTQGRKRGLCGVLACQRLSQLNKNAAAECRNVLIGQTTLDVDQKRGCDTLGMGKSDRQWLRELDRGEWFGFGPAFSGNAVIRFQGDLVKTSHGDSGNRGSLKVPAPSKAIRGVVDELSDLAAGEGEVFDLDDARARIVDLEKRLKVSESRKAPVDSEVVAAAVARGVSKAERAWRKELDGQLKGFRRAFARREQLIGGLKCGFDEVFADPLVVPDFQFAHAEAQRRGENGARISGIESIDADRGFNGGGVESAIGTSRTSKIGAGLASKPGSVAHADLRSKSGGETRMLSVLWHGSPMSRRRLGFWSFVSPGGGTFTTYLGRLKARGFVEVSGREVSITDLGRLEFADPPSCPDGEAVRLYWAEQLGGGARRMFEVVVDSYPDRVSRSELGARAEVEPTGGTFTTYLGRLKRPGLVLVDREGVVACDELFE